jgi:hypothetical protein
VSLRADAVFVAAAGLDSSRSLSWVSFGERLGAYSVDTYFFDLIAHSILFFERTGIGVSVAGSVENFSDGLFFLVLAGLFWLLLLLLLGGELLLLLLLFCGAAAFVPLR